MQHEQPLAGPQPLAGDHELSLTLKHAVDAKVAEWQLWRQQYRTRTPQPLARARPFRGKPGKQEQNAWTVLRPSVAKLLRPTVSHCQMFGIQFKFK